ncbi:MAG: hypothetical protein DPW18_10765 [Chloroflexi bacterium]|nr:hypothetical protein [Chloroflexota bacterium]
MGTKYTKVFDFWQRRSGRVKGLLVVKAQTTIHAKVNFGSVNVAIKRFVGKKARQTYSNCVMIAGTISVFWDKIICLL